MTLSNPLTGSTNWGSVRISQVDTMAIWNRPIRTALNIFAAFLHSSRRLTGSGDESPISIEESAGQVLYISV
jgi:hypothetical protein